jgi:hypothetical protein
MMGGKGAGIRRQGAGPRRREAARVLTWMLGDPLAGVRSAGGPGTGI